MFSERARLIDSNSDNDFAKEKERIISLEPAEMIKQISTEEKQRITSLKDRILRIDGEINMLTLEKEQCLDQLARISCHIVADRVRNSTTFVRRVSLEKKSTQIIDVVKAMCSGTQLLKFGNRGRPHYHQFEMTPDHQYLRWYSKKKKKEKWRTAIKLESIMHFQNGHLYKEAAADARYHERAFSISYRDLMKNETQTLEVVARTKTDFQIWTKGLELIIKAIKDTKKNNGGVYDVTRHFPGKDMRFMEIHKRNQKKFERKLAKKTDPTRTSLERCLALLEMRYRAAAKLRDEAFKRRDGDDELESADNANDRSNAYSAMDALVLANDRLNEMVEEIETLGDDIRGGNKKLSVLSGLLHQLTIEVQCLEEKLYVIC